jgi:N-methylhydantoinase A
VNLAMPGLTLSAGDVSNIIDSFNAAHHRQYGHSMDDPVEIVTLRLRATGLLPRPDIAKIDSGGTNAAGASKGSRNVYEHELGKSVNYQVYDREKLLAGNRIEGPATVEERSSTTVIHAGDALTVGPYGELVIETA